MMDDTKSIIRITQDFCSKEGYCTLLHEFSVFLVQQLTSFSDIKTITGKQFEQIIKKRKDYIIANDISVDTFSRQLYKKLSTEIGYLNNDILLAELKKFKSRYENGACQGIPKDAKEDVYRSILAIAIDHELFMEARCSTGRNDIIIPDAKAIIETKLWKGLEYYNGGFPELVEYLRAQRYSNGYYIIFDNSKTDNKIIESKNCKEIFDEIFDDILIHVIFIRTNRVCPSKKYKYCDSSI